MSLRPVLLLLALGISSSLHAATEFEDGLVPIDLVRFITGSDSGVYRSLPDNFPAVAKPAGLDVRVIGSMDRGIYQQVLLSSEQGGEALVAPLRTAYRTAGWVELTWSELFSVMCHDQLGNMQIGPATAGSNLLPVVRTRAGRQNCVQQLAVRQGGGGDLYGYFQKLIPVLQVPPQTTTGGPYVPLFSSGPFYIGTNLKIEQEGLIVVPDINVAGLYAHFAARMHEQGWQNDSEGSGTRSAISVWYKTVATPEFPGVDATEVELLGRLTILNTVGDTYRIQFTLTADLNPGTETLD